MYIFTYKTTKITTKQNLKTYMYSSTHDEWLHIASTNQPKRTQVLNKSSKY